MKDVEECRSFDCIDANTKATMIRSDINPIVQPMARVSAFEVESTIPNEEKIGHPFDYKSLSDAKYRSEMGVSENQFNLLLKGKCYLLLNGLTLYDFSLSSLIPRNFYCRASINF